MAACNTNDLLADGKCFVSLSSQMQGAAALQLWCIISGGIIPPPPGNNPQLWNPGIGGWNNPGIGPITNPDV